MIELLRHDDIIAKVGGRFKLATLMQRRWLQLMQGARPMVVADGMTELEVVAKEIMEGLIELEYLDEEADSEDGASN